MPVLVPFSLGLQTIRRHHNILPITLMWIYGRIFDDNHGDPMTNDFAYRNNFGGVAVVFSHVASVELCSLMWQTWRCVLSCVASVECVLSSVKRGGDVFSQVSSAVAMCSLMCSKRGMCSLKYPGRWSRGGRRREKWQRHPHPSCVCAAARGQLM